MSFAHQTPPQPNQPQQPVFTFINPMNSLENGKPKPIPYVIDGLLTQGGFSILGGKSKQGKSSLARCACVAVSKGLPFLSRETTQGEVILINLEDPLDHVANCLNVLGYDEQTDCQMRVVTDLLPTLQENIAALDHALSTMPDVRLVVIDTLAKFIRVKDLSEYMPVLKAVEQIRLLARRFPHVHIQGLAHSKKVKTDDPFDGLLGSTALRGEADTNLAIYAEGAQRIITTETRIGKYIPPTILEAQVVDSAGADVVAQFSLGSGWEEWTQAQKAKVESSRKVTAEQRIIEYIEGRDEQKARQEVLLKDVVGRRETKQAAIESLIERGVLKVTGVKQSPKDPLTLQLTTDKLVWICTLWGRSGLRRARTDGQHLDPDSGGQPEGVLGQGTSEGSASS